MRFTAARTDTAPTTGATPSTPAPTAAGKLPLRPLLALATAAFTTVLTEALPAGVLRGMSAGLGVSESATGQLVTVYAIGTVAAAIPLSAATSTWPRKRLLLAGVAGFAVGNTATAVATAFPVALAARFVAGVAAGVVWALLAGYARRVAPEHLRGKATALVMAGIPVALSLGVPAGTFLGGALGWRAAFWAMTALAVALIAWVVAVVPDRPGQPRGGRVPVARTLALPGVAPVLAVTLVVVLAHTILYTYVAAYLARLGLADRVDAVLLVFGVASVAGIWVVGAHIDRRLRALMIAAAVLFAVAVTALAADLAVTPLVYVAVALWGLGFGGVPTLLTTAAGDAGGEAADAAQALLVTLWNAAMAGGGVAGGLLLDRFGAGSLPWSALVLLVPALAVVVAARAHGFPAARR
ncbi:MFS transporter [Saccharothrix sp. 6-C]|uniref:MFS transporter n=1 Tax=Saccharothrix sp. 6-C TaxID=2781735 RepID=UPI001916CEA4|nr:MFS transporter [Saccharothrix sp. 6-C]QQQ74873.1 MFS transporter [Saccharothrix sp. 6-C]